MYLCRRFGGSCHFNLQVKFLSLLSIEPPQSNAIGLCSQLLPSPLSKVLATILASSSTFFLHLLLCVPLLHSPWRFQVKACSSMAEESFLSLCEPLHFHSLICSVTGFSLTSLHISSFEITLGRKISMPFHKAPSPFLGQLNLIENEAEVMVAGNVIVTFPPLQQFSIHLNQNQSP